MGVSDWGGVRERVEALAREDRSRRVFGAWDAYGARGHHFRLADPLSEADVSEAEAQWGVSLPEGYRGFLLEVGAGGAGPGYGLSTLGRVATGWLWDDTGGAGTRHDRLRHPCPSAEHSSRRQAEHAGREPDESAFEDEDAYANAYRAWLEEDDALFTWSTSGAVNLSHEGCGYCYWLIVSGPERGRMWHDGRPGDGTFSPLGTPGTPVGFLDWYLDWVEKSEAAARRPR
ncbi:SMI1/KNR4 family protein [Streptomyces sp. NPDC049040]|uniref:SMI1/KNR4 family protein n=1 Tax=Streptomyces sp. NPDC049040 TaxID=3365593 RepID=UPI003715C4E5